MTRSAWRLLPSVAAVMVPMAFAGCGSSTEELCVEACQRNSCDESDCFIECPQYRDGKSPCDAEGSAYYECLHDQLDELDGTCDVSKLTDLYACEGVYEELQACLPDS